jgi:hypothetical protein
MRGIMTTAPDAIPDATASHRGSAPPAAEPVDLRKTCGTGKATMHALASTNVRVCQRAASLP